MIFTIPKFLELWAPGGQVTDKVAELFSLIGRDLTHRDLPAAVEQSQAWLRPQDKERWDIPVNRPDDMERMVSLLGELGLSKPSMPQPTVFDTAVILGATSYSMEARLKALLESELIFRNLAVLGSTREVNDREKTHLADMAEFDGDHTEFTAGYALLGHYMIDLQGRDLSSMQVVSGRKQAGAKRATTDDTIATWSRLAKSANQVFVSHQPFGPRQALTVTRMLAHLEVEWDVEFLFGPLSKRVDENPALLVDTAARTLYELNKLPERFFNK